MVVLVDQLQPVLGIKAVIEQLQLPFCVASNSRVEKVHAMLNITGLLASFEGKIFTACQVKSPKPAPDVYLYAAKAFNTDPSDCLVIGVVVAKGAQLYESTPAISIKRMPSGWMVIMPQGRVFADQVMLASNAYSDWFNPTLAPKIAKSLIPVITWQMATEPQPEDIRTKILPGRQAVSDTHGDLRFFRWDARHRLVTGGALIFPRNGAERMRQIVGERMAKIFPHMGVPKFDFVWSGRIGMTAELSLPIIPSYYRGY